MRKRIRFAWCLALLVAVIPAGSCARAHAGRSDCAGSGAGSHASSYAGSGAGRGSARAPERFDDAGPGRPAAVPEALWLADDTGTLRAYDARTNRAAGSVDLGRPAPVDGTALVAGGGLLWAYRYGTGTVTAVDPVRARVVWNASVPAARPWARNILGYAQSALWIAQPDTLWRIGPDGQVTSSALPAGLTPVALAATGDVLWLGAGRRLLRVDPATGQVTGGAEVPPSAGVQQLRASGGGLYATGINQREVRVLDPATGAPVSSARTAGRELIMSLVDGGTGMWALGNCGTAYAVTGTGMRPVRVCDGSQDLPSVAALGSLWVTDEVGAELVRVDTGAARVVARIPLPTGDSDDPVFTVVAGVRSVWLLDRTRAGGVYRVDPATDRVLRLADAATVARAAAVVAPPPG